MESGSLKGIIFGGRIGRDARGIKRRAVLGGNLRHVRWAIFRCVPKREMTWDGVRGVGLCGWDVRNF